MAQLVQQYVFESSQAAEAGKPSGEGSDRFRLYEVGTPPHGEGDTVYVWERNPTVATGRAAEHWGMTATPIGVVKAPKTADAMTAMLATLPEAERAKFLAGLTPPAAPTTRRKGKASNKPADLTPEQEAELVSTPTDGNA